MMNSLFKPQTVAIGMKFGRLTVLEDHGRIKGHRRYKCACCCGNVVTKRGHLLLSGDTKSCGCILKERRESTHRMSRTAEYRAWAIMKLRCCNQRYTSYHLYGGKGVIVCDRWLNSFENFLEDVGRRPSREHTLKRIDVNGNYEPSNCKWTATGKKPEEWIPENEWLKTQKL